MNKMKVICALIFVGLLSGCATVATPTPGLLYTSVKGPVNFGEGTEVEKRGQACATNVLGLVAFGDASIEAAKKDAGIVKVTTVDHDSTTVLGLFGQFCTVAYGK